ncbi:MAG: hypothetical protein HY713_05225 [candidate division NC10 bacterium]|nr:hypothetical protein [candidate division NC10 bacterium]
MRGRDRFFAPTSDPVRLFRARKVSPLKVMHAVLPRIQQMNPRVNVSVRLARKSALP